MNTPFFKSMMVTVLLFTATTIAWGQHYAPSFTLNTPLASDETHEYVATEYIELLPGFQCQPDENHSVTLRISASGVNENENNISSVYPNPAKDELCFDLSALPQNKEKSIYILDIQGKIYANQIIQGEGKIYKMKVSNLNPGTFIYQILVEGKIWTSGKFIVQ